MRKKEEVLEKFHELRVLKLRERKERFLGRYPRNCFFNCRLRVKGNSVIGFCQSPVILQALGSRLAICNEDDNAKKCRVFQCKNTEERVEKEFDEILRSPARCGQEYSKLAMLIWFLQDFSPITRTKRFGCVLLDILKSICRLFSFKWW